MSRKEENYWPVNSCPLACFSTFGTIGSWVGRKHLFCLGLFATPRKLGGFSLPHRGDFSCVFFHAPPTYGAIKAKLVAGVTKYFGGALGRRRRAWVGMTWQRPGAEGSSCFYEPGNCRLSSGCASCLLPNQGLGTVKHPKGHVAAARGGGSQQGTARNH